MERTQLLNLAPHTIAVGDRFRLDYGDDDFVALKRDIEKNGLIQPIAVMRQGQDFILAAGGRRLEACKHLGFPFIPCRVYDYESDLHLRTIELAENIHRKDLAWEEQVSLTKKIHELQEETHGGPKIAPTQTNGWSRRDTANLLGKSHGSVNRDLLLADAVTEMPEAFKSCRTKADAEKVLKRLETAVIREEMAKKVEERLASKTADERLVSLVESYHVGDCLSGMRSIPNNSFSIAEIDPPYNLDLNFAIKNLTEQQAKDLMAPGFTTPEQYFSFMFQTLTEVYRILKPDAWCILWHPHEYSATSWESMPVDAVLFNILKDVGFTPLPIPALWTKPNFTGITRVPKRIMGSCYESFFYAFKGSATLAEEGQPNIFPFQPIMGAGKTHPTERPVEMIESVLKRFTQPGDSVLIPFLGSGNTLLSAFNLKLPAIGFEKNPDYRKDFVLKAKEGFPGPYRSVKKGD